MSLRKCLFMNMVVLAVILGILSTGFSEVKRGEIISFPGTIEQVAPDFKFIVVNEAKIVITPQTKIADGRGSVATINELKAKRFVRIEALRRQDGFIAQTILLLPLKGHAGK
jgi:hypothetical protein